MCERDTLIKLIEHSCSRDFKSHPEQSSAALIIIQHRAQLGKSHPVERFESHQKRV